MELIDDVGAGRVGVDTSVFIYSIEESLVWLPVVRPLFVAADAGVIEIVTSSVTLLEVLVAPYRAKNDAMTNRYEALLTRSRGVNLVDLPRQQLRRALQSERIMALGRRMRCSLSSHSMRDA